MANWFTRLMGKNNSPELEEKDYLDDFRASLVSGNSKTSVTPDNAMMIVTVYACVRVISESVAQLPFSVIKKSDNRRERDDAHQLYKLFSIRPNSWMTPFEYFELLVAQLLLRGNHYAYKIKSTDGRILELIPINPANVQVEQLRNYDLIYKVNQGGGVYKTYRQDEIFHVRGLGSNGFTGVSPITLHRSALGLAKATETHGSTVFTNGARPGGVLKHPGKISKDSEKRLKDSWDEGFSGENANRTAVLEEGMDWTQLGMTNEDSQYLETRKFQRGEIASIFRVPPHKIGDLENATFSNIEHQGLEFVQDTLLPWVRRIEQAIQRDLMPMVHRNSHYVKLNVDSILRGDIKTRYEAYSKGIQWGFLNADEARELEDRNPREHGDEFLIPLNMIPASRLWQEPLKQTTPVDNENDVVKGLRATVIKMVGNE